MGGAVHQHHLLDLALVHPGIAQAPLHRVHVLAGWVFAQLFKPAAAGRKGGATAGPDE